MEGASTNTGTASGTRVTAGTEAYLSQINTFPAPPGDIPTGGGVQAPVTFQVSEAHERLTVLF